MIGLAKGTVELKSAFIKRVTEDALKNYGK